MPTDPVREAFEVRSRQVYEHVVGHITSAEQVCRRIGLLLQEGADDPQLAREFEAFERTYTEAVTEVGTLETEIAESGVAFAFHGLAHPAINMLHALAGFIGGAAATIQGWVKPKLLVSDMPFPRLGAAAQRLNDTIMNTMRREGFDARPVAE